MTCCLMQRGQQPLNKFLACTFYMQKATAYVALVKEMIFLFNPYLLLSLYY